MIEEDILKKVKAMDNEELLDEYRFYAGGDDYDGCWTKEGRIFWVALEAELTERLKACGFLKTITYYCDNARHLVCKPYSRRNLELMANELNIHPDWLHKGDKLHYYIPKRRVGEITAKCVVVNSREIIKIIRGTDQ
jgi:hypothetical protein